MTEDLKKLAEALPDADAITNSLIGHLKTDPTSAYLQVLLKRFDSPLSNIVLPHAYLTCTPVIDLADLAFLVGRIIPGNHLLDQYHSLSKYHIKFTDSALSYFLDQALNLPKILPPHLGFHAQIFKDLLEDPRVSPFHPQITSWLKHILSPSQIQIANSLAGRSLLAVIEEAMRSPENMAQIPDNIAYLPLVTPPVIRRKFLSAIAPTLSDDDLSYILHAFVHPCFHGRGHPGEIELLIPSISQRLKANPSWPPG